MQFRMSPNVAIRTRGEFQKAASFYHEVLGFPIRRQDDELVDLDASPMTFFVIEDEEIRGPVMELFVDDLEEARRTLEANGCTVLRWRGKGQDCYVRDPFGVVYNVWQD